MKATTFLPRTAWTLFRRRRRPPPCQAVLSGARKHSRSWGRMAASRIRRNAARGVPAVKQRRRSPADGLNVIPGNVKIVFVVGGGGNQMKVKIAAGSLLLAVALIALPCTIWAAQPAVHVSGEYIESRTADVFTGPCFANSEVNLTGQEAVLAWHIEKGTWGDGSLDGLSVAAVGRGRAPLGAPVRQPLPPHALPLVVQPATAAHRAT